MKLFFYPTMLVAALGCDGNTFQQDPSKDEIGSDSGDTGEPDETDTDTDSDTDSDTDADTDADTDTDTDADTDADTDVDLCTSRFDPLEVSGYIRYYDVRVFDAEGTGQQEQYPATRDAYVMYDEVVTAQASWYGSVYVGCDAGADPGLYLVEWDMSIEAMGTAMSAIATPDQARMYLPADADLLSIGSWNYSYASSISSSGMAVDQSVSGTFTELGMEPITLADGSRYDAYHLLNEYSMSVNAMGMGGTDFNGELEQWWVEGLGLVKEVNTNLNDGSEIMYRELTSYVALTPI